MIWIVSVAEDNANISLHMLAYSYFLPRWPQPIWRQSKQWIHANQCHTHQYLEREPAITDAFDIEEELVCVGLWLVQGPCGAMISRFHCDISNDRNSHIRMCF